MLKLYGYRTLHLLTVLSPRVFSVLQAPTSINAQKSNKKQQMTPHSSVRPCTLFPEEVRGQYLPAPHTSSLGTVLFGSRAIFHR